MSRQAIVTRYFGPTDHRDARIKASASAKSIWVPWDHAFNVEVNHALACSVLVNKLGWDGKWHQGSLPDNMGGYVFVMEDDR